eukprot:4134918-Pleurochrysis_carterae.AAC.1
MSVMRSCGLLPTPENVIELLDSVDIDHNGVVRDAAHSRTHARTRARARARTHARTHTRTHARTHTPRRPAIPALRNNP